MSEELLEPDADKRMKAEEFADYYEARDEGKGCTNSASAKHVVANYPGQ